MSFTFDLTGWRESETSSLFDRLQETLATGGTVFGVWDSDALAGLASLDVKPVGGNSAILKQLQLCSALLPGQALRVQLRVSGTEVVASEIRVTFN